MRTKTDDSNSIQSDFALTIFDVRRTPEFIEFVKWYATPSWERKERTQKEFAVRIGVCPDTLTDWKRHPSFGPFVWGLVRERMQEQIPDVIEGLYGKIVSGKGGAGDVQLFLRLAGDELQKSKQ